MVRQSQSKTLEDECSNRIALFLQSHSSCSSTFDCGNLQAGFGESVRHNWASLLIEIEGTLLRRVDLDSHLSSVEVVGSGPGSAWSSVKVVGSASRRTSVSKLAKTVTKVKNPAFSFMASLHLGVSERMATMRERRALVWDKSLGRTCCSNSMTSVSSLFETVKARSACGDIWGVRFDFLPEPDSGEGVYGTRLMRAKLRLFCRVVAEWGRCGWEVSTSERGLARSIKLPMELDLSRFSIFTWESVCRRLGKEFSVRN